MTDRKRVLKAELFNEAINVLKLDCLNKVELIDFIEACEAYEAEHEEAPIRALTFAPLEVFTEEDAQDLLLGYRHSQRRHQQLCSHGNATGCRRFVGKLPDCRTDEIPQKPSRGKSKLVLAHPPAAGDRLS